MKRMALTFPAIAIAVAVGASVWSQEPTDTNNVFGLQLGEARSETVRVELTSGKQSAALSIPEACITWPRSFRGGRTDVVRLDVDLRDLGPFRSRITNNNMRHNVSLRLTKSNTAWIESEFNHVVRPDVVPTGEIVFGLERFVRRTKDYPDGGSGPSLRDYSDYYVVADRSSMPNYYVACALSKEDREKGPPPTRGCEAKTELNGIQLTYNFRRTELSRWREIDGSMKAFVQTLMEPKEGAAPDRG